jgi:hypothetical protein
MNRPRPWYPLDVAFFDQDTIRDLGGRFGAAGPLVIVALVAEASAAIPSKTKDWDVVDGRWSALARRVYAEGDTTKAIVKLAVELGLLEAMESSAERFRVRLLKWHKWHAKDPTAATRKAKQRAKTSPAENESEWV